MSLCGINKSKMNFPEAKPYQSPCHGPSNFASSSTNRFEDEDRKDTLDLEREKKSFLGRNGPEMYLPDTTLIKTEPVDDQYVSSNLNALPQMTGMDFPANRFPQSDGGHSRQDTAKVHNDSSMDAVRRTTCGVLAAQPIRRTLGRPWPCSVCSKGFKLKVLLKRHMKSHTTRLKPQRLEPASKPPSTVQNNLSTKKLTFSRLRPNSFRHATALRKLFRNGHFQNRSKARAGVVPSRSSCFVCQKWFSHKAVFKLHMLKVHTAAGDQTQTANVSDNSSPSTTSILQGGIHVAHGVGLYNRNVKGNRAIKEKKYKCPLCDKSFTQSGKLSSHKKSHTGEKPFHCSVCGKDFALKDHLNIHIKIHTGEKPYPCLLCDKSFRQGGHLRMHMQTHTGIKPHRCEFCDKAFSQKGSLMSHMRIHTGDKLHFQCTMCDKSFRDSTKLNNHIRTHTGEKPFQCSLCDKAFSQSGDLVRHMRTHTGEKPYVCTVCNKQFSEGSNLNKHMRTHTGYKPHECSICHKSFSEGSTLKNHMRIHSGEKPYQCSVCQKEFIQSGDLYKHMRTHTGEKPHNCPVCDRAFTESSTLRKHMKTHRKCGEEVSSSGKSRGPRYSSSRHSPQIKSIKVENTATENEYGGMNLRSNCIGGGVGQQNADLNTLLTPQNDDFTVAGSQSNVNDDYSFSPVGVHDVKLEPVSH